jgi:hypothetical protein
MLKFTELVHAHRIALQQCERGTWLERHQAKQELHVLQEQMLEAFEEADWWDEDDRVAYRWMEVNQ